MDQNSEKAEYRAETSTTEVRTDEVSHALATLSRYSGDERVSRWARDHCASQGWLLAAAGDPEFTAKMAELHAANARLRGLGGLAGIRAGEKA